MKALVMDRSVDYAVIKESVPITWLLDHYGLTPHLRPSHEGFRGVCPIHNGHNPTQFSVSVARNCWVCFGDCQSGGSVLDLVSRMERVSLPTAAGLIQQWFDVPSSSGNPAKAEKHVRIVCPTEEKRPNSPLRFALSGLDAAHPYLALRGLAPATTVEFGLGYCTKGIMAGRIAIPIHNRSGELVAYAGRWPGTPSDTQPKYLFPRGFRKSLELFNYHRAIAAKTQSFLVVVEGFFDCMKVWQAGFRRVVAIMGSSLSDAQEDLIVEVMPSAGEVVLMFDEDGAGRLGREKAAARLARRIRVEVVELEVEGTQPDHLPAGEIAAFLADAHGAAAA